MAEKDKSNPKEVQKTEQPSEQEATEDQQTAASREPRFAKATRGVPEAGSSKQGMSSGAKWGIGLGACCCCLIVAILIFLILGFAGCSFVRSFGGYNWPTIPSMNEGTEIPIPSFSNTPR